MNRLARRMAAALPLLMLGSLLPGPAAAGSLTQGASQRFPETGKTVSGALLDYWTAHGGLVQQGYPIADEFQEKSDLDGKTYTVQYFQRAVFELHPENQPPFDVLLSQLGTYENRAVYDLSFTDWTGTHVALAK